MKLFLASAFFIFFSLGAFGQADYMGTDESSWQQKSEEDAEFQQTFSNSTTSANANYIPQNSSGDSSTPSYDETFQPQDTNFEETY